MILQALYDYYRRKAADPESRIAPEGWEWREIPFLVVIDEAGHFRALQDTREGEGKVRRAKRFLVPQGEKRTLGIKAFLLWDNVEYVFGASLRGRTDLAKRHEAFKKRIREDLGARAADVPVQSVLAFLEHDPVGTIEAHEPSTPLWKEALESNAFVTFRMDGSPDATVFDTLGQAFAAGDPDAPGTPGLCLITGEEAPIERLHPPVKGVRGTNTSGGAIVSFNLPAFGSYGKEQNFNAPVGKAAAFAYTTALNVLLDKNSPSKASVGDATAVFWAQHDPAPGNYDMEHEVGWFFADPPKDDPDRGVRAVKGLYDAARSGKLPAGNDDRFFVLGLAPNAARISVRFWRTGTVQEMAQHILGHFDDMAITHGPKEPEHLTLNQMLRSTVLEYKMDNVPPNLAGAVMTSILDGTPYPRTLLLQCLRRIRAERHVNRPRAALLKGCLNRTPGRSKKEALLVSLDRSNTNIGYRLGRLFSVLEKIQEEASPNLNATIRDRFYGAASSTPVTVFSRLLKLKNHHLAKLEYPGRRITLEREIGDILDPIASFPGHLALDDQAFFALGYYHQRQDFFKTSAKSAE